MDATKYARGGKYVKKADVRRDGPQTLTIATVTEVESLPDMKGKIWKVLELTFTDDRKFTLSAEINRARIVALYGPDTDGWLGKRIVIYFNPDIRNPRSGGEAGGLRVQEPDSDLYDDEVDVAADLDLESVPEPEPVPQPARPAAVAGPRRSS
jgi:hypothetical protein